jgi:uncharacterized SAM-binding protein YcdF (DUF218 family)
VLYKKTIGFIRLVAVGFGITFILLIILAFTSLPFWTIYWMGTAQGEVKQEPDYIVLLGGAGMPGAQNLMRAYYTSVFAQQYDSARIIIALPCDSNFINSPLELLKKELVLRGIKEPRIALDSIGTNTRAQALYIASMPGIQKDTARICVITCPDHMYRAIRVFRRAGFKNVDGISAFEGYINSDLTFQDSTLGGRKYIPDVGGNISFRYQVWTHLKYEITILREFCAIAYYKLKGWI